MPKQYKSFLDKEKKDIQKRHDELVKLFNSYLPDDKKISSIDLSYKFSDSKIIAAYRIASELKEKRLEQEKILDKFHRSNDFDMQPLYPFPSDFKTDGSKESEAYNKELYIEFINEPDKTYYRHFKNVFKTSAKELCDLENDPQKNVEYYRDHYVACEDSKNLMNIAKKINNVSPDLLKQIPCMEKLVSLVTYPKNVTMQMESEDFLACPELSVEQANILKAQGLPLMEKLSGDVIKHINESSKEFKEQSPKEFAEKFRKYNFPLHKADEFITKYTATRVVNGENVYVPLEEAFNSNGSVKLIHANKDRSTMKVDTVTLKVQEEYSKLWQKTFNQKRGVDKDFDINEIEKENRGGFFERNVFRSTSKEYKNMIQALKDFNNPTSKHYLDFRNLENAAKAYEEHKLEQGYGTSKTLSGTSLKRSTLAENILDTIAEHKKIFETIDQKFSQSV